MDKLTKYREIVQKLLCEYAEIGNSNQDVETQIVFDTEHEHYQLMNVGWKNNRRIYGCFLLLILKMVKFGYNIMVQNIKLEKN